MREVIGLTKNCKLGYKQYNHTVNVSILGDFLTKSLHNPRDLIKARRLLTDDNILYFTQNTKSACNIPLGMKEEDNKLKIIDLLEESFEFRHNDKDKLNNLSKNIIIALSQNYNPDEYEVYHDLDIQYLEDLCNFHKISNTDELDNIYKSIYKERCEKYIKVGSNNYKDYRKINDDKLVIFIISNDDNIQLLGYKYYSNDNIRYGITYISFEQSEVFDSSTLTIDNTIRPNIDENIMRDAITTYKRMLSELINMKELNNLFTGEILENENGNKQALINLPLSKENIILELCNNHYNYCSLSSNDNSTVYNKVPIEFLRLCPYLDEEVCTYIITGAVYTVVCENTKIQENLKCQYDLTKFDKSIINKFVSKIYNEHFKVDDLFKADIDYESYNKYVSCDRVLYETSSCKLEIRDRQLLITLNGKEKCLQQGLISLFNHSFLTLDSSLINIIITYESYIEYGIHIPQYAIQHS